VEEIAPAEPSSWTSSQLPLVGGSPSSGSLAAGILAVRVTVEDSLEFEGVVEWVVEFKAEDDTGIVESSTERWRATEQETFDAIAVCTVSWL
jgi:hypothetical protein